jgi:hypothetical protein
MYYLAIFQDKINGYSYFRLKKTCRNVKNKVISEYRYSKKMGINGRLYDKLDQYGYDTLNLCEVIPFVHHTKEEIIVFMDVLKDELRNRDIDIV